MITYWRLDENNEPQPCSAEEAEQRNRVAYDFLRNGSSVSTILCRWNFGNEPRFETLHFPDPGKLHDDFCLAYKNYSDALAGHETVCKKFGGKA